MTDVTGAAPRVRRPAIICPVRTVRVYLLLLTLLAISLGAGLLAADWPALCTRAHWCEPGWPRADPALHQSRQSGQR
jgi:hypothetical protein